MSVEVNGLGGRSIQPATGETAQTRTQENQASANSARTGGASGGADRVSLTDSATQLQALESRIAALPVVDSQRVTDVQRALATGSFQIEPAQAADNLLTQEREFAMLEVSK